MAIGNMHNKWWRLAMWYFGLCEWTERQTNKHTHHNTLHHPGGRDKAKTGNDSNGKKNDITNTGTLHSKKPIAPTFLIRVQKMSSLSPHITHFIRPTDQLLVRLTTTYMYQPQSIIIYLQDKGTTHTTTVLRLCGICLGKPGWAGTRRNIHPLLSS